MIKGENRLGCFAIKILSLNVKLPEKNWSKYFFWTLVSVGNLQFILYHVAGFYKPTITQSPPSHLRDYSTCNNARLEFSTFLFQALIQINGALTMVSIVGV